MNQYNSRRVELFNLLDKYFNEDNDLKDLIPLDTIDGMIAELRRDYGIFYNPSRNKYTESETDTVSKSTDVRMSMEEFDKFIKMKNKFDDIKVMLKKSYNIDFDTATDIEREFDAKFENVNKLSDRMMEEMNECKDYVCRAFNLPDTLNWKDVERYFKNIHSWQENQSILFDIFDMLEKEFEVYGKSADTIKRDLRQRLGENTAEYWCEKISDSLGISNTSFEHIYDAVAPFRYYKQQNDKFISLISMLKTKYNIDVNIAKSSQQIADELDTEISNRLHNMSAASDALYESMESCRKDVCELLDLSYSNETTWEVIRQTIKGMKVIIKDLRDVAQKVLDDEVDEILG